jgi:hypothetical protein
VTETSRPGRARYLGLACLVALPWACSTPPAALRADTLAYLQKMSSWAPTEAETARTLERILATEFVDQAEVLRQISDSTPRVQRQLAEAEHYEPRTSEVRRIHAVYVGSWQTLLDAYGSITAGFETGDQRKLSEGRDGMARWRDAIMRVAHELRELRDRTGADPNDITPS